MAEYYNILILFFLSLLTFLLWVRYNLLGYDNPFFIFIYVIVFYGLLQLVFLYNQGDVATIDGLPFGYVRPIVGEGVYFLFFAYLSIFAGLILSLSYKARLSSGLIGKIPEVIPGRSFAVGIIVFVLVIWAVSLITGLSIFQALAAPGKYLVAEGAGAAKFNVQGYTRFLMRLGMVLFLFLYAYGLLAKGRLFRGFKILLAVSAILAFVPPFITSGRGFLVFGFISILLMELSLRRVNVAKYFLPFVLVVAIFFTMSSIRSETASAEGYEADSSGLSSLFLYGGGSSVFNQALLVDYVEQGGRLYWGEIYIGVLVLPIPRSIWPEKPLFSFDQIIASEIYGYWEGINAIPSGVIGEALLNFGYLPSLVYLFFIGIVIGGGYRKVASINDQFLMLLVRCVIFPRFLMMLLANGVGFALMEVVLLGLPILFMYSILTRKGGEDV